MFKDVSFWTDLKSELVLGNIKIKFTSLSQIGTHCLSRMDLWLRWDMILWLLVRVLVEWIMKVTCVHLMRCHYTLTYNFTAFIWSKNCTISAKIESQPNINREEPSCRLCCHKTQRTKCTWSSRVLLYIAARAIHGNIKTVQRVAGKLLLFWAKNLKVEAINVLLDFNQPHHLLLPLLLLLPLPFPLLYSQTPPHHLLLLLYLDMYPHIAVASS